MPRITLLEQRRHPTGPTGPTSGPRTTKKENAQNNVALAAPPSNRSDRANDMSGDREKHENVETRIQANAAI
jgi:hypothetical protein